MMMMMMMMEYSKTVVLIDRLLVEPELCSHTPEAET